ncbi:olfactory receptor 1500-like [Anomaloglossus baeobatrachus]
MTEALPPSPRMCRTKFVPSKVEAGEEYNQTAPAIPLAPGEQVLKRKRIGHKLDDHQLKNKEDSPRHPQAPELEEETIQTVLGAFPNTWMQVNQAIAVPCLTFTQVIPRTLAETHEKPENYCQNNLTSVIEFFLVGFQSSEYLVILLFCLLLVIYCCTLCGNLLIITLVSTSRSLHSPMYFFLTQLSISDILLTTDIVPNTLHILLNNGATITFIYCFTQFYFFGAMEASECFLLTVMSYDRYVAICNPFHYTSIMTSDHCVKLSVISWFLSFSCSLIVTLTISMLTFCGRNIIDHFFCDTVPLLQLSCSDTYTIELEIYILSFPTLVIPTTIIIISYINIIVTILRCQSRISRQKVFSTCSSHLTVVSIFYCTLLSVYVFSMGGQTLTISKLLSLMYTVVTPFFNPIIYSLRNKEIKKSLQKLINRYMTFIEFIQSVK